MVMESNTKAAYEDCYNLWGGNIYYKKIEKKSQNSVRNFKALFDTALVIGKNE